MLPHVTSITEEYKRSCRLVSQLSRLMELRAKNVWVSFPFFKKESSRVEYFVPETLREETCQLDSTEWKVFYIAIIHLPIS